LEQSFAQFQTDKGVVGVSRRVSRLRSELAQASEQIDCHLGDFLSYARIREEISQLESAGSKQRKAVLAAEIADSLTGLMVGDIVWLPKQGWSVVLTIGLPQRRDHKPWVRTLSMDHTILSISTHDLRAPLTAVGRVRVPKKFSLKERKDRRKLINAVAAKVEYLDPPEIAKQVSDDQRAKKIKKLRNQLKKHPSHECPEREQHALEAVRAMRIERELQRLVADTDAKTNSLANSFDRITKLLTQLGYLEGEQVTANGKMLSRVYNELDLVVCEAIQRGIFDGLDAPALAAVLSSTVYESRPVPGGVPARMPERTSEQAQTQLRLIWREIRQLEQEHKIEPGRDLDIGFAEAAWRWASGQELAKVLDLTELSAGDFVRWVRQVIDL
ncbi:MAG: RNA helicase, partial [Propionibacterium sp.]